MVEQLGIFSGRVLRKLWDALVVVATFVGDVCDFVHRHVSAVCRVVEDWLVWAVRRCLVIFEECYQTLRALLVRVCNELYERIYVQLLDPLVIQPVYRLCSSLYSLVTRLATAAWDLAVAAADVAWAVVTSAVASAYAAVTNVMWRCMRLAELAYFSVWTLFAACMAAVGAVLGA